MKVLVMMPTYNEINALENSVSHLLECNPELDVLIMDDNSPDGTGHLAQQLADRDPRINVMHRTQKAGLGRAYLAGYQWGIAQGYDRLVQMDADGSHRPEDLRLLLEQDADLVIGSRWVPGGEVENWPKFREFISKAGNWYARFTTAIAVADLTAGFRVYSSKLLSELNLEGIEAQGYGFQIEMTRRVDRAKASIAEVPIRFVERVEGSSKMTWAIVVEAFWLCTKWGLKRLVRR
jgi:dolichol-phosphate mannosyltransferase